MPISLSALARIANPPIDFNTNQQKFNIRFAAIKK